MAVIQNKWVEKERKRRTQMTAPSYESDPLADSFEKSIRKPEARHHNAARATLMRTLRGVRK